MDRQLSSHKDNILSAYSKKTFQFSGVPADSTGDSVNYFDPPPEGVIPSQIKDSAAISDTAKQMRLPRLN